MRQLPAVVGLVVAVIFFVVSIRTYMSDSRVRDEWVTKLNQSASRDAEYQRHRQQLKEYEKQMRETISDQLKSVRNRVAAEHVMVQAEVGTALSVGPSKTECERQIQKVDKRQWVPITEGVAGLAFLIVALLLYRPDESSFVRW